MTPYETATANYATATTKVAEMLANPKPNYTADGVSIDRLSYYRFLLDAQKLAREAMVLAAGPWQIDEYL